MKEEILQEVALERKKWEERREKILRKLEENKQISSMDKEKFKQQLEETYAFLIKQHDAMQQFIEKNSIILNN